jgi:alpha-tubulin suppressor-like RCC1 family protein
MRKNLSIVLVFTLLSTLIWNITSQSNKAYAYVTNPKIVAGYEYVHVLKSDGTIQAWGKNEGSLNCSLLGNGYSSFYETSITQLNISNIKDVVTASTTSFALSDNGTVYIWGANNLSQMGVGGNSASGAINKAGFNVPTLHPYLSGVKRIVASNQSTHVFAILDNGTVMGWGYNSHGQLGNGRTSTVFEPNNTGMTNVKDIALGSSHSLALFNNGTLFAAGYNYSGQLGINSTTNKSSFVHISTLSDISKVFAGGNHSFAVKNDGTFYAWGDNGDGELGVGTTGKTKIPTLISGIINPSQVSTGSNHVIVLMPDGTVKTAGDNSYGQLGYTGGDSLTFNTVPGITNAIQVQAGYYYTMVLLADGTIKVFGKNNKAQLGLGYVDTDVHSYPTTIPSLSLFQDTIPPIITVGDYNINPTKQDITVTASTNEGTLNATSHTFTENGSFEFVATDKAGNVTRKTVSITNIDKTAPIITLGEYNSKPTNQDIVVTATTNEGTLNTNSHTFTVNGSFIFTATDIAGNVTEKAVTITNIDKVAPIITIDPYNIEPTNKDVIVNASTNEGSLNATSHTFTSNGSFDFVATDEAGNVTSNTVIINHINKTAPIISIGSYNTNYTNENILVTASVDKGTLNETSHTFFENGSFEFVATDNLGNTSTKAVTITNIDKRAPLKPTISVLNNNLTIVSGTDGESGVKEILYQINDEVWKTYSDTLVLEDGDYVIKAKTIDYAGNESLYDIYCTSVSYNALNNATKALVKAESTFLQVDLNKAIKLINALPDNPEKIDLLNRADNLQKVIEGRFPIIITSDAEEIVRRKLFNLHIKASSLEDLYTMQFEIRYEPEKLELDQTKLKNLAWEDDQNGYAAFKIDESNGVASIIYSRKGITQGVNGDSTLMNIPFKALQIGKTTVYVSKIKFINSKGEVIKYSSTSISKDIIIQPNPLNVIVTGEKGQSDWYVSPITVEIDDLDAKEIHYSMDGITYSYTQPFTVDEIGEHNIKITTNDGHGYMKEKEQVLRIDYNSPTIAVNNQDYDWMNEVKVIPKFDDLNGSGVSQCWYQWTNTSEQPEQWDDYNEGELIQSTEGIWYLHIKAIDVAGNASQNVFGPYQIDGTAPRISIDTDKREAWGVTDVSVTPTFSDEGGSQLKYVGYHWSIEQSAPIEYTSYSAGSLQQSNDGAWYLHLIAEDWAGNIKTKAYGPYNIDKNAPSIEVSDIAEGISYTDSVTPLVDIKDSGSGIKVSKLQLDGKDYVSGTPVTERGVHTITAFAEDYTGNTSNKSITFFVYKSTTLTLDVPNVEYSDIYTIKATLTTGGQTVSGSAISVSGSPITVSGSSISVSGSAISVSGSAIAVSGAAISIRLNGTDMGIYYTDSQGNINLDGITPFNEGIYTIEAIYLPGDGEYYSSSQCQSSLTVLAEKNSLIYTDSYEALAPGLITIQALLKQENDSSPGDISLAKFRVEIHKLNEDGSTILTEEFIAGCDTSGNVIFERNYDTGTYTVDLKLLNDGYYIPGIARITVLVK